MVDCEAHDVAVMEVARLERRIAKLEAALDPFAKIADEIEASAAEAGGEHDQFVGPARWEDCKRAREALRT